MVRYEYLFETKICFSISLLFVSFLSLAGALPSGAPQTNEVCKNLLPHHGVGPQNDEAPYRLVAYLVNDNKEVNVTLMSTGTTKFKGFIIQPRFKDDKQLIVDGTFTPNSDSKTIDCFNKKSNTLTHNSPKEKSYISVIWKPTSKEVNEFVFNATVVKKYTEFFTNIVTETIEIKGQ